MFDADERESADNVLTSAWEATGGRPAANPRGGSAPLAWFDTLDGYGSLDPLQDLRQPGITDLDGQTIHCQSAQSYAQFVPLHDPDSAQTICPIGHSDRQGGPFRQSTMTLWGEAKLHPAPLRRAVVERISGLKQVLAN